MKFFKWWIKELSDIAKMYIFIAIWLSISCVSMFIGSIAAEAALFGIPLISALYISLIKLYQWVSEEHTRYTNCIEWDEEEVVIRLKGEPHPKNRLPTNPYNRKNYK